MKTLDVCGFWVGIIICYTIIFILFWSFWWEYSRRRWFKRIMPVAREIYKGVRNACLEDGIKRKVKLEYFYPYWLQNRVNIVWTVEQVRHEYEVQC